MTWIEAFILGIVQGTTEFFPISSSAHLKLTKLLFGIQESGQHELFNLVCHLGTLLALFFVFRKEIVSLLFTERKKLVPFILALLPLIPGYLLLHPILGVCSAPIFLGLFLLVTSAILFLGHRSSSSTERKPLRDALYIGSAQVLALFPGISRSASTICCARLLGWSPKEAVHFSFLLSVPTILGGSSLELFRLFYLKLPYDTSLLHCGIGFFSSFIMGTTFIRISLRWLENGVLKPFAWYCLIIGTLTLLFFFHG
ncbi:MAG TPA: undecaprenyl-diphosphate phosphatase [Rhabdochlamydiaceae bacterium]|nr:undecaprenyl-diphosphate phosphatase [Rhabdochlamydiaceae bacterium]